MAAAGLPQVDPAGSTDLAARPEPARRWRTVVWDDPVNLMSYVTYVLQTHFGYSRPKAERLMLQVHEQGRAIVARGARERMESDVQAMHSYGLSSTIEHDDERSS